MNTLEQLGIRTAGLVETKQPFEGWEGSPIQSWKFQLRMLTMGDLVDIAKLTSNISPLETAYLGKIYLLAKCLQNINGSPLCDPEDVEEYNKEHNLNGTSAVKMFDYKVLFIRKWTEAVVNRLSFAYDELQDEYLEQHLGRKLPDALKAAVVSDVDLSSVEEPDSGASSGTTSESA